MGDAGSPVVRAAERPPTRPIQGGARPTVGGLKRNCTPAARPAASPHPQQERVISLPIVLHCCGFLGFLHATLLANLQACDGAKEGATGGLAHRSQVCHSACPRRARTCFQSISVFESADRSRNTFLSCPRCSRAHSDCSRWSTAGGAAASAFSAIGSASSSRSCEFGLVISCGTIRRRGFCACAAIAAAGQPKRPRRVIGSSEALAKVADASCGCHAGSDSLALPPAAASLAQTR